GRRLGKQDRLVVWTRPQRPAWMDEETYQTIPETLTLRMLRYHVVEPGRRTDYTPPHRRAKFQTHVKLAKLTL
ncbi:MAG: hypothetical protein ACK5Q5_16135, partial [Planctomycetaceae bacterium]